MVPSGFENVCEDEFGVTKPYVLHAEANAITKVAQSGNSSKDATLYVTASPCMECAKLIIQAGIRRVVYRDEYRITDGIDLLHTPSLDVREYIYDMPMVMAAADLVICRAGAATISEVCASGTPCIMVPSPNVTDNHQEKNALALSRTGAAALIREADCDGKTLFNAAKEILSDGERLCAMRAAAANTAVVDAAERIYQTAIELAKMR